MQIATYYQADDRQVRFWDGDVWRLLDLWSELFWQAVAVDVVVPAGQRRVVATGPIDIAEPALIAVLADFPCVEFTDTSGGALVVEMNIGGQTWALGNASADRALAWPLRAGRRQVSGPVSGDLSLRLRSVAGAVTAHGDDGTGDYGSIEWRASMQPTT